MYITTYAADAQPSLDMRRLWHDNSSLMSKCKHYLMDSSVMRKQSSPNMLENDISRVTLECDRKGCGGENKIIQHVRFSWWVDQNMASHVFNGVCYDGTSLLSSCIMSELVYRKWRAWGRVLAVGSCYAKHPVLRKTKAMTPWFKPFKNIMSALWNLSLCRQF